MEHARPVLTAIGDPERLRHCGPVGSDLVVKLLNNYLVAVNAAAVTGEALALAREAGVDVRTAIEAVVPGGGGAGQRPTRRPLPAPRPGRGLRGRLQTGYMVKDLRHAFDLAAEPGVESPLGRAAGARMDEAAERHGTEVDFGSVPRISGW